MLQEVESKLKIETALRTQYCENHNCKWVMTEYKISQYLTFSQNIQPLHTYMNTHTHIYIHSAHLQ